MQFWFLNIGMICSGESFFIHEDAECLNPLHLLTSPISIGVIAFTSFLDCPSLPYLGSVTTTIGFPRPQRFWPRFNHLQTSGTRIQGLIYESVLPHLMISLEKEMKRDLRNFQDQTYYLILNDTTGLLVSVIERGRNYAVVVARGAQIKSATLCHRDQRSRISETLEDVVALQRKCLFQTKGATLSPIRHLNRVKGLIADSFNLSSRCVFDVDFNRKLLRIFLYLLIDSYDDLSKINSESGIEGEKILECEITDKQYSALYNLFPHGFGRQRIRNFKWLRTRQDKLTRNTAVTPRYDSSLAYSVRDISLHGMNTPSGSVGPMATAQIQKIVYNVGDEESELNEPSFLASIEEHPGQITSAFFTKVQREMSGGGNVLSSSAFGPFSHARSQQLHNFSSALSPQESKKNHSALIENNFKLKFPQTLGRERSLRDALLMETQPSKTDRNHPQEEYKEFDSSQKLRDFSSTMKPYAQRRPRALSDSSYDIVNDEWGEDHKETQNISSPFGTLRKEVLLNKTQVPHHLLNLTRIQVPKMNETATLKEKYQYGKVATPLNEGVQSWCEDFDQKPSEDQILANHHSNPVLPLTFSAADLKDSNHQPSPTTYRFGRNKSKDRLPGELPKLQTYFVDQRTQFLLELCIVCFPYLDDQPESFLTAYENILNSLSFIQDNPLLNLSQSFHQKVKLHKALQMIFIKALVAAYLRIIHLEEEPIKGFNEIASILESYKILSPQQFQEARFSENAGEGKQNSAADLDPEVIYCTVFSHDDIQIHQVRTGLTDFTMFGMKKEFLRSIWGNMMFEIMFVNNDNPERNSLQSNRFVLQNLSSELAEHPLGYCAYSSGPMLLYF